MPAGLGYQGTASTDGRGSAPHLSIPTSAGHLEQGVLGHGCCLQENQALIASWESPCVLLGTAALGWDTTVAPGGWLEPDTSQHKPSQLVLTVHTRTPAWHCFTFGNKGAAPHACSAGHWRGMKLFKVPLGTMAAPSTENRPQQLFQHSSTQP